MPGPTTVNYKVAESLYLVRQPIAKSAAATAKPAEVPVNHVFITDCSGSMWGEIDKVREHIKTKVPKLMKEGDTLSLIAFSGRGQFWRILTAEPVATLSDLTDVNKAIDRWLRPVGMTGFKEPIEDAGKLIAEVSKTNKNPFSLTFMSDGYENQWPQTEVLKAIEKTGQGLSAATVVSYGNYADLVFLTKMAEKWGGVLVQSENFPKFQPVFEAILQKKVVGGKKIEVQVGGDVIGGFAFGFEGTDLVTFGVENGDKVSVNENLTEVVYLSPTAVGASQGDLGTLAKSQSKTDQALSATYAAISLFAVRMKPDVVLPLLKATGDVTYIEQFSTLFGRQKYAEFQEATQKAAVDPSVRWAKGYDPTKVPRDDAFTVLELLNLLQQDDGNRVLLGHKAFQYNRIGRARVDSNSKLSDAEQAELDALNEELTKAKKDLAKAKEISGKIAALTNKPDPLKFVEDKDEKGEGYPVNCLTFNEDRANVSIQVRKEGTVDLSARLPDEFKGNKVGKVPTTFRTFCFRNYAVVKDGIVNVGTLPLKLTDATKSLLTKAIGDGKLPASAVREEDGVTLVNLREMPVINRKMVKAASAATLFNKHWELTKSRAAQKVYNSFMKEHFPGKKSEGFSALYGEEAAKWLAEQGITDYSGFGPKMVQGEAQDVYMAKCLEVKLKGYSSIPSLNDFKKQATKGKFNGPAQLMQPAVDEVNAFMASDAYTKAANKDEVFETWLDGKCTEATTRCRKFLYEIAQIKFSIIVGQVWFTEFPTINDNSLELTFDKTKLNFAAELREVEEKV